jgi:enamine deaminase RidA (YjgF/YER057c/UK114 family)
MTQRYFYFLNMTPTEKLSELAIDLPSPPAAAGLYKPVLVENGLIYFSGHLPIRHDGTMITGKVGDELTVEDGKAAARQVGLNILASVKQELGTLDRLSSVVKLLGMVNSTNDFTQHPQVINGCSELFKDIWGDDNGVGVRSAFGVFGLPAGVPVEIEGIFKLKNEI